MAWRLSLYQSHRVLTVGDMFEKSKVLKNISVILYAKMVRITKIIWCMIGGYPLSKE